MNAQECKELVGWLSLEYPAIIEEFNEYKKEDPDFLNVGPSDEYFEVKSEIDVFHIYRTGTICSSVPTNTRNVAEIIQTIIIRWTVRKLSVK